MLSASTASAASPNYRVIRVQCVPRGVDTRQLMYSLTTGLGTQLTAGAHHCSRPSHGGVITCTPHNEYLQYICCQITISENMV